jgi:hypothetical protein
MCARPWDPTPAAVEKSNQKDIRWSYSSNYYVEVINSGWIMFVFILSEIPVFDE